MCNRGKGRDSCPIRAFPGRNVGVQAGGFVHGSAIFCTAIRGVCGIPASFAPLGTLRSTHPRGRRAGFSHRTHILYPHTASLIHEKLPFMHAFGIFRAWSRLICTVCTCWQGLVMFGCTERIVGAGPCGVAALRTGSGTTRAEVREPGRHRGHL
jgi:hypothetical protein